MIRGHERRRGVRHLPTTQKIILFLRRPCGRAPLLACSAGALQTSSHSALRFWLMSYCPRLELLSITLLLISLSLLQLQPGQPNAERHHRFPESGSKIKDGPGPRLMG